jgi:hypothetical protein
LDHRQSFRPGTAETGTVAQTAPGQAATWVKLPPVEQWQLACGADVEDRILSQGYDLISRLPRDRDFNLCPERPGSKPEKAC